MSCPACGERVEPGARFCSACGHQLVTRHDERRVLTVLFGDLVGFTALSEAADPEQVKNLVDGVFEALAREVTAFGGHVDKIIGDAILALFGAPVAHEDDAERAVRAALRMQEVVAEKAGAWGVQLRVGVNTGEVLVGALRASGDVTAMGDVVNTAQRLQSGAEPGTVVVGRATREATAGVIEYDSLGRLQARGREEPVDAWVARAALLPPGNRRRPTYGPLVGRQEEITLLSGAVGVAIERSRAQLILLMGDAGVGKSRLAAEAGAVARGCHDALVLEGRCVPYGEANVWWPVAEAVKEACSIQAHHSVDAARELCRDSVRQALRDGDDGTEVERVTTGLLHLMGYETSLREIDPARAREEVTRSVLVYVEAAARSTAVVVLLSDLHWADEAVLDLIGPLLERVSRCPVVLIATARHELEQRWSPPAGRHSTVMLTLDPLGSSAADELLRALAERELDAELRRELIDRSGGNPLFLEELVALISERGASELPTTVDDLPATLRGLISARIDGLDELERCTLEDAAVWGGSGPTEALRQMGHAVRGTVDVSATLDSLAAKDVLSVDGEHWAFRSDLVREVAYSMLTKAHRAQGHYGIAKFLAGMTPDPAQAADRSVDIIANHYGRAAELVIEMERVAGVPGDVGERALPWIEEAARRAAVGMVPPVARQRQTLALRLLDDDKGPRRVALLLARARTAAELRDILAADADVAEARTLAGVAADEVALARADLAFGDVRMHAGDFEIAETVLERARVALGRLGDVDGEADALRQIGMTRIFQGKYPEADEVIEAALDRFRMIGDRRGEAWALQNLAWVAYVQGNTTVAQERLAVAARTFDELGDRGGAGWTMGLLAFVKYHQGDHEEAARIGEQILAESRQRGDMWAQGMMQMLLGGVRLWSGHALAAIPSCEKALELFGHIDDQLGQAMSLAGLTRALTAAGRIDEARARFEEIQTWALTESASATAAIVGAAGASAFLGEPDSTLALVPPTAQIDAPANNLGDGDLAVARALALLQRGDIDESLTVLESAGCAFEGDGSFPYALSILALASAASGQPDRVGSLVAAVHAAARSTYLDRAVADLAEALLRSTTSPRDDAEPAFERILLDLTTTDDVLITAVARLAWSMAAEAAQWTGADELRGEADAALDELGLPAAGWRRVFAQVLASGAGSVAGPAPLRVS